MKKILLVLSLMFTLLLSSCSMAPGSEPFDYTANNIVNKDGEIVQLFKSYIKLTAYNERYLKKVSSSFQKRVESIHIDSDRYNYYLDDKGNIINNLKVVNDSYGTNKAIKISDDLYELLDLSLTITDLSEGYFNITMGSLIDFWTKKIIIHPIYGPGYVIIDPVGSDEFNQAFKEMIPYSSEDSIRNYIVLNEEDKTVTFKKYKDIDNIKISLGSIAKGYAMYKTKLLLEDEKEQPMMIDGGSSSLALLNKPVNKDNYSIGLVEPYTQSPIYIVNAAPGTNVSTSGDYLHYTYVSKDNCDPNDENCTPATIDLGNGRYRPIRRHHIISPFKGYSENFYRIININANDRADVLDALSTVLFNIDINTDKITFDRIINNFEKEFNIKISYLLEQEVYTGDIKKPTKKINITMNKGMEDQLQKKTQLGEDLIGITYTY